MTRTRTKGGRWLALVVALVVLVPALAQAHTLAFGELHLVEARDGSVAATLRLTGITDPRELELDLGEDCVPHKPPQWQHHEGDHLLDQRFDCGEVGLSGSTVGLQGPESGDAQLVVRALHADGRVREQTIRGDERVALEHPSSTGQVLTRYVGLGVEHILLGFDHLLFVLGLVLLTIVHVSPGQVWRRLALTITAFTLGHSVTLALTVLDLVRLRPSAVEAMIALSIVLLAVDLVRRDGDAGLTRKYPWLVAAAFGLLHGCGFAGALREVGLPADALGTALLGFNVGVELGQLLFVGLLLLGGALLSRMAPAARRLAPTMAYTIGGLAASWLIERVMMLG